MPKFILISFLIMILVGIGCQSASNPLNEEKNFESNKSTQVELFDWNTYTYKNTTEPKFNISFQYPNGYVVFDPCTTSNCLIRYPGSYIYKQGTEPDLAKFTTDAEGGFSSSDILVQWYPDSLELKDVVGPYQNFLINGTEKTYGQNHGLEFTNFGPAGVNLFSFKTAGYLFEITDRTYSKYNQQDFSPEDWELFLSSIIVTEPK